MPVETTSVFSQVIQEHLELKRKNAELEGDMPLTNYEIDDPLPAQPIFGLIQQAGGLSNAEMYRTFNMGTGFCCVIPETEAEASLTLLRRHYPAAKRIGHATSRAGALELPAAALVGDAGGFGAA